MTLAEESDVDCEDSPVFSPYEQESPCNLVRRIGESFSPSISRQALNMLGYHILHICQECYGFRTALAERSTLVLKGSGSSS
jgi:hypothetical protein